MYGEEIRMVLRALYRQGWSKTALAQEFRFNWRTVDRRIKQDAGPTYGPRACPAELAPDQLAHIVRRLLACPSIRSTTLYREVADLGYEGSYASFNRRVRTLRSKQPEESEVRFETGPGVQTQMDWAEMGTWPLGEGRAELKSLVGVLGFSRTPAFRFATDKTRPTTLRLATAVFDDLGGSTKEVLTDRDSAFVIGQTSDGRAIFAPEWVDLTDRLGTTPKACKAYRAKTKGKVERVIREIKEDFVPWLAGQALPPRPAIADYDALAAKWVSEVVLPRRHRTTGKVVLEAWEQEQPLLATIPDRLVVEVTGQVVEAKVIDLARLKADGAVVEHRPLSDYDRMAR
jgi:transposase